MSQGVQKIIKKLDGIASKHARFGLNLDHKYIRRRREETCSRPDTEIIGRDADLETIVGMLLNPVVQRDVSFTTIVGMGGLGKTALAQLVFKHEKIIKEFPLRLWTCVSDHDHSNLDVKTILAQIIESATGQKYNKFSLVVVVNRLQEVLAQGRFLIVLDDLWSESRDEWRKLVGHLVGCGSGCQVLVTTRSKETAKIVGNGLSYELKGLSFENSWHLFQMMAFEQVSSNCDVDLVKIGQDIVKKCANVPLAIRVIGALLYGQEKSKWVSIQESGLANLRDEKNGILPIIKLSYHNLESPLKSCFSYCSLYPKDFEIKKELLISLWIAQGYVVPLEKGQSIEEASEEYFSILLQRCFFQDVRKDESGEIVSFKLHDLIHDVAFEVAKKEICPASSFTGDVDKVVRHASLIRKQYASYSFTKSHIRTYLHIDKSYINSCAKETLVSILTNYKCLRTLDLSYLGIKTLPASIGKLIHLRYLDISGNPYMEELPNSIKKLYNLQSLNLNFCGRLKALPKDFSKLVNLRVLKLLGCDSLTCMPLGMGKLTDLYNLTKFVVGERNSSLKQHVELGGLKPLTKLRGSIVIDIYFSNCSVCVKDDTMREGGYIRDKEHLDKVRFECNHEGNNEGAADHEEKMLGYLQPHANLKELELVEYRGARLPRWGRNDTLATCLPNLAQLLLYDCSEIQCLPLLQKLYHLERLALVDLKKLEYVECQPATGSHEEDLQFLPCLEQLRLLNLPKLKAWCRRSMERVGGDDRSGSSEEPHQSSILLSQVKILKIEKCPELTSLLHCPKVETLQLHGFNERLQILKNHTSCLNLKEVETDNLAWLHSSLPMESFRSLTDLKLIYDKNVKSLTEFEQVFRACSSSLRSLNIGLCPKCLDQKNCIFGLDI
ncbi:hypothetical protein RND81_14G128900 [Saponaria officinalis]|uniref:NB-ARC domain-containing protein n=1 Tax=Saponaria officinalis TaxID=3572 RepID=A0AAW1GTE2_SAPOF